MKNSLVYLVQKFLSKHKIKIDNEELSFQIQSHPSYPSLHAITGVLDHFNISNLALDVPVNENTLRQLPKVFMAQLDFDGSKELVIAMNKGLAYQIHKADGKTTNLPITAFLALFTGIVLAVEKDEAFQEPKKSKTLVTGVLIGALIALSLHLVLIKPALSTFFYFAISLVGVIISYAIFKQTLGESTVLGNMLCAQKSESKNCDSVLHSKGAKLFQIFELSDLSAIYFISLALTSYLFVISSATSSLLFTMSLLAVPITFYSIYYQSVVTKKWCQLCLGIVALLWVQATIAILSLDVLPVLEFKELATLGFAFGTAYLIWHFTKKTATTNKDLNQTKLSYTKFKRNFSLFQTLLDRSNAIDTTIEAEEIIYGNARAPLELTVVTNPFCGHCRPVHTLVETIDRSYKDLIKIKIRFNVNIKNPGGHAVKITSRLLELFDNDPKKCNEAMHDFYEGLDAERWLVKWGECMHLDYYKKVLEVQKNWCSQNNINFTPELLINGRSFPKEYDRGDLIYFIEDLEENCCRENTYELQLSN